MIAKNLADKVILNNGVGIPQVGLGVWRASDGPETRDAVRWALELGYRSIDTASLYANERSVGEGFRDSGLKREDVFITTKVWNPDQGYENTLAAFDKSLGELGMDFVDMYLVHYPVTDLYLETWRALEKLYREGRIRAIGVSNFHPYHLDTLLASCAVKPVVNQIELHPYLTQKGSLLHNIARGVLVEAWAPIAKGRALGEPVIVRIAQKYGKTPAQVVLRWELQQGIIIIPKSVHRERILENSLIFDFELTPEEMLDIDGLERNGRIGTDPDKMTY